MATCSSADSILEAANLIKTNSTKLNTFVNGTATQTVQLGTGAATPTLRKFIADAQDVVTLAANDAADTVVDTVAANSQAISDLQSSKVNKIGYAESGNIAEISSDGGIADSGRAVEDFATLIAHANLCSVHLKHAVLDMIEAKDAADASHRQQIRLFNGENPTASSKPVLFIVAGQSNAQGSCDISTYESAADIGQFWAWNESTPLFKPLKDPVYHSTQGSAWPAFARKVFALTGRKVLFLNVAFGGSAVTDGGYDTNNTWADNGYGNRRTLAKNAYDAMKSYCAANSIEYDLGGMLWIQGEAEAARLIEETITIKNYKDGTEDVFEWFRTTFDDLPDLKIFVSEIGSSYSWETNPNHADYKNAIRRLRNALREVVADDENSFIAYSLALDFIKCGYTSNNTIHYNQEGYNLVANAFARCVVNECGL